MLLEFELMCIGYHALIISEENYKIGKQWEGKTCEHTSTCLENKIHFDI